VAMSDWIDLAQERNDAALIKPLTEITAASE
jgi:hypothetical protein